MISLTFDEWWHSLDFLFMETRFYSREDDGALSMLEWQFVGREGYVWFIEQTGTQLWLMENGELTNDPNKCMQFPAMMVAATEKIKRGLHHEI